MPFKYHDWPMTGRYTNFRLKSINSKFQYYGLNTNISLHNVLYKTKPKAQILVCTTVCIKHKAH